MRVSTPETTAYDLVRFAPAAGRLSNVATVLGELAERIEAGAPVAPAPSYQVPKVQRLGYLLALLGEHDLAAHLAAWLETRRFRGFGWRRRSRTTRGSRIGGGGWFPTRPWRSRVDPACTCDGLAGRS